MLIKHDLPEGLIPLIEKIGTVVTDGQDTYYHLPLWFYKDHTGTYEVSGHELSKLMSIAYTESKETPQNNPQNNAT